MRDYKIYAVDFDGTLCKDKWPEIGEPNQSVIDFCIRKKSEGHKIILWTCREGQSLIRAVLWCNLRGLFFDAVNTNLPDKIKEYGTDPRKIGADYFIDDRNLSIIDCI
jgi:hypothetical protein